MGAKDSNHNLPRLCATLRQINNITKSSYEHHVDNFNENYINTIRYNTIETKGNQTLCHEHLIESVY
jgi:hypothetical protein